MDIPIHIGRNWKKQKGCHCQTHLKSRKANSSEVQGQRQIIWCLVFQPWAHPIWLLPLHLQLCSWYNSFFFWKGNPCWEGASSTMCLSVQVSSVSAGIKLLKILLYHIYVKGFMLSDKGVLHRLFLDIYACIQLRLNLLSCN